MRLAQYSVHSVEKREILSHLKNFRLINYLVISFVKPLHTFTKYCQKSVRMNFRNYHIVNDYLDLICFHEIRRFEITKC